MAVAVPNSCGGAYKTDERELAAWHDAVVANQKGTEAAQVKALSEVALTPPLRMELDQLRFSPDGKSILAQDEGSVFVLSRAPLALRYRIDAGDALAANFSPDSQSVTFSTPGLHTEQWSVSEKKLLSAHELLWRDPCYEAKLAPDGRTLLCVGLDAENLELSLNLLDTASSQLVWQKKSWAQASWPLALDLLLSKMRGETPDALYAGYTTDNNVLLLGSGSSKVAFDFRSRTPLKLGNGLQFMTSGEYAFVGSDRVAIKDRGDFKHSGLFSFPEGKQLRTVPIPPLTMRSVTNSGTDLHLIMYGSKDFDVALSDLGASKFVVGLKTHALDEYAGMLVAEAEAGGVSLIRVGETDMTKQEVISLPLSPLSALAAAAISPDGRYLAASTRYRGGLWDLSTGKRMASVHGFTDVAWTEDNTVFLEMAAQLGMERHMSKISISDHRGSDLSYKLDENNHMRYGRLTEWKQDEKKKSWTLSLHDFADNRVIWTREFRDAHLGYSASYGDRDLLMSFGLKSNTAKDAMKTDEKLAAQALAIKNKDQARLVRVIDAKTGEIDGSLVLEVPLNYAGLDGVNRAGDLLYVTGADDRTSVYSMKSGKELRKLFGVVMALDPASERVCTANRVGEAVVYQGDGEEIARFQLGEPIRHAAFRQSAKVLTVLTADQKVRTLALPGASGLQRLVKAENTALSK